MGQTVASKVDRVLERQKALTTSPHYLYCSKADTENEDVVYNYDNLLFGKLINANDICPLIPKVLWTEGTVYNTFNQGGNFYVAVRDSDNYNVFKCLYNTNGVPSTVIPTSVITTPFETTDGYIWKYMYTVSVADFLKFGSSTYMPVQANSSVTNAAVAGTIDSVQVEDGGLGYTNAFAGKFEYIDIEVDGYDNRFALTPDASSVADFYNGCYLYILNGVNQGDFRKITDYIISNGSRVVELESPFPYTIDPATSYEIWPSVTIDGDGNDEALGMAIVQDGTVLEVRILNSGKDYRIANVTVNADNSVNITKAAVLTPIISPPGGHGSDVFTELGAKYLGISVTLSNTLPTFGNYTAHGILKEPEFDNVKLILDTANQIGQFIPDEEMIQYRPLRLFGNAAVANSNTTVVGTGTKFASSILDGDEVLITDGLNNHFAKVIDVPDDLSLVLNTSPNWSNTNCSVSLVNRLNTVQVKSVSNTFVYATAIKKDFDYTYPNILGSESYTTSKLSGSDPENSTINTEKVDFSLFNQVVKIKGFFAAGIFLTGQKILQPVTGAYGVVQLWDPDGGYLYLYGARGNFQVGAAVQGEGGAFVPTEEENLAYLSLDKGQVLYIKTTQTIDRSANKTENIRIILEL